MIPILAAGLLVASVVAPQPVTGTASWYHWRAGEAAAGPALRVPGWRGSTVQVCGKASCATVTLSDWCQCYRGTRRERIIDLDYRTFREVCGPLSRGLCEVRVL